jgi:hypothetical protein
VAGELRYGGFMNTAILEKDRYEFQKARIMCIGNELAPKKRVVFVGSRALLNFYIRDEVLGINITERSGEFVPGVLADMSDDTLRDFIKHLSNGKIG